MLTPLKSGIIFKFLEDVSNDGLFTGEKTQSGIMLVRQVERTAKSPRWGIAVSVGPACKDVKNGDYILIENLMWTNAAEVEGDKIWRTDESKVIGVQNELPDLSV